MEENSFIKQKVVVNKELEKVKKEDAKDPTEIFDRDDSTPLGFRIKRKVNKDIIHKSKFLKNNSNFIIVVGTTGCGKSTALLTILPMFSNLTKYVVLVSKKMIDDAHTAIKNYCEHENIEFKYLHSVEEASNGIADILDEKKEDEHMVVIFDDFLEYSSRADEPHNHMVIKTFAMLRSSNCSAIAVTQSYSTIPTKVRENTTMRIVFALGNIYSVRTFLDDVTGLFYEGDNEKIIKHDIKEIYKNTFKEPFQFIVVTSTPPQPQIRLGWNKILYPPEQEGTIAGGSVMKPKRKLNSGLIKRQEIAKQAIDLNFPKWRVNETSTPNLLKYIDEMTKAGQSNAGNTAPEISLSSFDSTDGPSMRRKLQYHTRRYLTANNPKNLKNATKYLNNLVVGGQMTEDEAKHFLHKNFMDDYIEF